MSHHIISLENFTTGYERQQPVLSQVNLQIYEGDFIVVVGPNGGGKTTLVKSLLRLLPAYQGAIQYYQGGKKIEHLNIGYLPQRNQIDTDFPITVNEVVQAGLLGKDHWGWFHTKADRDQIKAALATVGMSDFAHESIGALSGGQLQRVLLARAIVSKPHFVVLDEPNSYLDQQFESQLYPLLQELNKQATLLIVSHEAHSLLPYVNRCIKVDGCVEEVAL